jgi:hypothetical protein
MDVALYRNLSNPEVKVVQRDDATKTAKFVNGSGGWTLAYDIDRTIESGDATIALAVEELTPGVLHDGSTKERAKIFGTLPTKAITVIGSSVVGSDNCWYYIAADGNAVDVSNVEGRQIRNLYYDGNEYPLIFKAVAEPKTTIGDVSYQVWNGKTASWDAAEKVVYGHAAEATTYRAKWVQTVTASGDTTTMYSPAFELTVLGTNVAPNYAWTNGNGTTVRPSAGGGTKTYDFEVTAEQAANPAAFIDFANGFVKKATNEGDVVGNPDADLDTIKAFFAERYTVVVTKNELDENIQKWTIEPNDLTPAEKRAFVKKYETFIADYAGWFIPTIPPIAEPEFLLYNASQVGGRDNATVNVKVTGTINPDSKVDDINFVNAPNVTYKAKKIKKKAKSFTVEAKAESGNAIKYSIDSPSSKITIDSATGKVTVAKKLKKGTYSVVVKAKTDAGNGYQACMATRTIKIKVKK